MSRSSPSPIQRKMQYSSPLRSDRGSDDFDDMPEYVPIVRAARGPRGRYGIKEIAQIVGSKNYRDIKRSGNFMPGHLIYGTRKKQVETINTGVVIKMLTAMD